MAPVIPGGEVVFPVTVMLPVIGARDRRIAPAAIRPEYAVSARNDSSDVPDPTGSVGYPKYRKRLASTETD